VVAPRAVQNVGRDRVRGRRPEAGAVWVYQVKCDADDQLEVERRGGFGNAVPTGHWSSGEGEGRAAECQAEWDRFSRREVEGSVLRLFALSR
jgi:hypothetical protein